MGNENNQRKKIPQRTRTNRHLTPYLIITIIYLKRKKENYSPKSICPSYQIFHTLERAHHY